MLLKVATLGVAGSTLSLGGKPSAAIAGEALGTPHWGYTGELAPEHWGELSTEYQACQWGTHQSPIDLAGAIAADLPPIHLNYQATPLRIVNNGHTIQVNYRSGSTLTIGDRTFELVQFHFHHPSEHRVQGQAADMELHLVHRSASGALAVVGVLLTSGAENLALKPIFAAMPDRPGPEQVLPQVTLNAQDLLPQNLASYRYFGSLTTPPCFEEVTWIVLQQPVTLSVAQIRQFAKLFPGNARPVNALNQRFLLRSP
ncbi:carbonic anhydrase [Trichothermofontia sp.]